MEIVLLQARPATARIGHNEHPPRSPLQHLQPATRVQFGLGALQYSITPPGRIRGRDDDEYENEAPCEGGNDSRLFPGLKTWAILLDHFMVAKQL
jgi:hypothetical protein